MKKLTISLVLAVVLVSGAALAADSTEKADSNTSGQATQLASHTCSIQGPHACGTACAVASIGEDSVENLLNELILDKVRSDRNAALQAEVDLLLEIIDFE